MKPYPPCTWVAVRALSMAASEVYNFAIAACCLKGSPRCIRPAASRQARRDRCARICISAIMNCTAWLVPIGRPKASLSWE